MLPRRSTVLRCFVLGAASVIVLVWVICADHRETSDGVAVSTAVKSQLSRDFSKLQFQYGGDSPLIPSVDLKNMSLLDLLMRVLDMSQHRPKNPHSFRYVVNAISVCSRDVFLLVYVHSSPSHFKQRMAIRQTWGNAKNFPDVVIKVIFLCGIVPTSENLSVQDALSLEADYYNDIVQEDFVDTYRNLTYKGILGLKWVSAHCRHAEFLLKSDDDIFINMFSLVTHLQKISSQRGKPVRELLLCHVWYGWKVMRDPRSKRYLSPSEFADDVVPVYCSGSSFIMTPDVAVAMYNASFRVPFFWIDDVYVTGMLAREVGVTQTHFDSAYMLFPEEFLQKFTERNLSSKLVVGHIDSINSLKIVWNKVLANRRHPNETIDITTKGP